MIDKQKIVDFIGNQLEGSDKFLVAVDVSPTNVVDVFIDGDNGINIGECASLSRLIEHEFDREVQDYELRVSSPGLDRPFVMLRQYQKYMNRPVRVELFTGKKVKGKLLDVNEAGILIELAKEKKVKEITTSFFQFNEVKSTKAEILFK